MIHVLGCGVLILEDCRDAAFDVLSVKLSAWVSACMGLVLFGFASVRVPRTCADCGVSVCTWQQRGELESFAVLLCLSHTFNPTWTLAI